MIPQTPNLRSELVDTLSAQIEAGDLKPGERLPTEQAIMEATGVSRTIVREALASLRAKGMITTRQGLGAFVSHDPTPRVFSILSADLESIEEVLQVLELRIGIEAEAVGLAAQRRTAEDLARMTAHLDEMDHAIEAGGYGADEDFAFHRAILTATGNPYYARLFDTFGRAMIPRQWSRLSPMTEAERRRHNARVRKEHRAILAAIETGNARAARTALRQHLGASARRFALLRQRKADV
ncbi:FadR/GntR family transcriptional regulator [Paracoccus ravus]|uniref:FadR/GntR family transcriptional regulator n=1 Tax=Paracoccus ravus TaxID=2447760 RepID=UPI001ADC1D25|nr:FadR/GntR family transcriptional regulator [Paracoccus ravus]